MLSWSKQVNKSFTCISIPQNLKDDLKTESDKNGYKFYIFLVEVLILGLSEWRKNHATKY